MQPPRVPAILTVAALAVCAGAARVHGEAGVERFVDSRNPPTAWPLDARDRARFDLGHAVFNTHWVPAGTPRAERRDGVGPLYNSDSCDECHNEGARGRGPIGDGPAPPSLVVKLESRTRSGPDARAGGPDPVYGYVLNAGALEGMRPEGEVLIHYTPLRGRYPDGEPYSLRVPHYRLVRLRYGPLAPATVIEPRIAPAIFGDGLLEDVADGPAERFNWQGTAVSVRDQTAQAFAREMGLTNPVLAHDDCTARERDCLARPDGGTPEVSPQLFDAVVLFERALAVPRSPLRLAGSPRGAATERPGPSAHDAGRTLFISVGCAACHTPQLTAEVPDASGTRHAIRIAPYTDLRRHDLGAGLADEDAAGRKVPSRWRTPPLWGLGYRLSRERRPTFLHDARARSLEEAILWHAGEAAAARERFERLPRRERQALIAWLATL